MKLLLLCALVALATAQRFRAPPRGFGRGPPQGDMRGPPRGGMGRGPPEPPQHFHSFERPDFMGGHPPPPPPEQDEGPEPEEDFPMVPPEEQPPTSDEDLPPLSPPDSQDPTDGAISTGDIENLISILQTPGVTMTQEQVAELLQSLLGQGGLGPVA